MPLTVLEMIKQLESLIRDMLFDIPVIPDRYKYVERLKEIVEMGIDSNA